MAIYTIPTRLKHRFGTYTELYQKNEVLLKGEECFQTHDEDGVELDPYLCKVGDGSTPWNDLEYQSAGSALTDTDGLAEGATNLYFTDERAQDAAAAMIAAGTHSGITFTYDDANNKISANVTGGGSGNISFVGTATVAGAAATTLSISGLDLATDGEYRVEVVLKSGIVSNSNISIYYNSDTTATNYDEERLLATATSANAARGNDGFVFGLATMFTTHAIGHIRHDLDGKASGLWQARESSGTSIQLRTAAHHYRTATNITGITVSSSAANAFVIGSYIKVWKVTG